MGKIIQGLKGSIAFWNKLPLSVMERVALSKMVLLPRCLYALQNSNCLIPRSTFAELNSLLVSLVWAGKRNRVKLEVLKLDLEQGGLGLPDLQMYYLSPVCHTVV